MPVQRGQFGHLPDLGVVVGFQRIELHIKIGRDLPNVKYAVAPDPAQQIIDGACAQGQCLCLKAPALLFALQNRPDRLLYPLLWYDPS